MWFYLLLMVLAPVALAIVSHVVENCIAQTAPETPAAELVSLPDRKAA